MHRHMLYIEKEIKTDMVFVILANSFKFNSVLMDKLLLSIRIKEINFDLKRNLLN